MVLDRLQAAATAAERPNIILVMADDMGWGQTGYYQHPRLKTPALDEMAAAGLRFDRFYAGAPVCSPTRASVLTGRANDRCGVKQHGFALRLQEQTIAEMLREAGYATGHFGKWHLDGLRGPGVPILSSDTHHPGHFGFDTWLSVTNFFDRNPILSRQGEFEEFTGDSSEVVMAEAIKFAEQQVASDQPFFAVVWFGTPHSPFVASGEDREPFQDLDEKSRNHYGELVAMDRSIGNLRKSLRDLKVADDTLVWFCSDNGGLPGIVPDTVGGLRGNKGTLYEGGLRVPAIIEWPAGIPQSDRVAAPASTMDILPTLLDVASIDPAVAKLPLDGISLASWFQHPPATRSTPIPFRYMGGAALIDNDDKLLTKDLSAGKFELYDLQTDPQESMDQSEQEPQTLARLRAQLQRWSESVDASVAGKDYPAGRLLPGDPEPQFWHNTAAYQQFLPQWRRRPEYGSWLKQRSPAKP